MQQKENIKYAIKMVFGLHFHRVKQNIKLEIMF
nr:MAG TPA: hypothetical protein [Caudoviricetes sp.]